MRRRADSSRTKLIDPAAVAAAQQQQLPRAREHDTSAILDALCDITRLRILRALAETPLASSDIAHVVSRTPPATSQHLRILRDAGIVSTQRSGSVVRYRLSGPAASLVERIVRSFDVLGDR